MEEMFYLHSPTNDTSLPEKLYIEPTSRCNFHCSICFRNNWINPNPMHMSMQTFSSLLHGIENLNSIKEVFFAGMGEPLFNPLISDMVKLIPSAYKKSLLTNASLLTPDLSRRLLDSGLDELWVSMDGFDENAYAAIQLGGSFTRIKENLRVFNSIRGKEKLNITFVTTTENIHELDRINAFADEVNADMINISYSIPSEPVKKEDTLYDRRDIPIGKMHRFNYRITDFNENICPFVSENALFIRSDGEVIPCMQLLHDTKTYLFEEERTITSFGYGNVNNSSIIEIWNNEKYKEFRHRVNTFYFPFCTVCWGCEDRKQNLSDCFTGEAPTCGACLWATGRIRCP